MTLNFHEQVIREIAAVKSEPVCGNIYKPHIRTIYNGCFMWTCAHGKYLGGWQLPLYKRNKPYQPYGLLVCLKCAVENPLQYLKWAWFYFFTKDGERG